MIGITIENLAKKFGETFALNGINLEIRPGEMFFLLGPSGCGKTTLLRAVAGFNTPECGRILFGGEDVTRLPAHRRNTGMMFQSYALWPHMTVAKNVSFGLDERRVPAAEAARRVADVLATVRMADCANRRIAELSGGQQQRVALARALVVRPQCLLLDEPLSNLDAKLRLEMRDEIRRVTKEFGLTAIYVTHDQKEALSISDRMAILVEGRIAQTGTPEDVYRRPHSKTVAGFIGETNFFNGKIVGFASGRATVDAGPLGMFEGMVGDPNWLPRSGDPAAVSVRPEAWSLQPAAAASNSVRGRVGATVYLGEIAQYRFSTPSCELKIFELNPRAPARVSDRDLFATAAAEDVVVLRP
jgi:iron(III) transport system ATP-binding protein